MLRDLFLGAQHFEDFQKSPEGIATNILGDRLRRLERDGLISRTREPNDRRRFRYELTIRGKSLDKVMLEVARWGVENIEGTVPRVPIPRRRKTP
ncbi:MAG: putative transcriptional regulator [Myxococcaceae bacterium]|nr:putative transcriptional regulator [Myxococcaceae bacterium]